MKMISSGRRETKIIVNYHSLDWLLRTAVCESINLESRMSYRIDHAQKMYIIVK